MLMAFQERHKVFLLEDSADDERLAIRALRVCGIPVSVEVARDGEEGWEKLLHLRAAPARPDLVLSDLKMPKLGGDEVLRRVRADGRLKDLPFVVFSSSDEPGDVQRCLALGASAFIRKPVDFGEYISCMREVAERWLLRSGPTPFCSVAEAPANGLT